MEVGLVCCCIEKCSSRLGLLCYAFGWSRCTASFRSRRESLWIDVKRMVEELLNELIDRDKIELTYRLRPTYLYHIPSSDAIRKLNLTSEIVKRCCCSLISSSRAKHFGPGRSLADRCRIRFPARSRQDEIGMPSATLGRFGDSGRRTKSPLKCLCTQL
jgi:hypothetical protein